LEYIVLDGRVIDELERTWKEVVLVWSRYYRSIRLKEPKKTTQNLNQDNRYPGRDSNQAPPEYKSTAYRSTLICYNLSH
jgi:hypothetical protein